VKKGENGVKVPVFKNVLEANDRIAEQLRELFASKKVLVINLMSSPGAGKTTLLEATVDHLKHRFALGVIEGDIQSSLDAERLARHGIAAVQVNTGGACHLDGNMIWDAVQQFNLEALDLLIVENVGNLVCPAEFSLGEQYKVMILSTTEGDDKPQKYPLMFTEAHVLLINKIDLLPYLNTRIEAIHEACRELNPGLIIFEVSATRGDGLEAWLAWLEERIKETVRRG
jgi:hydrogenase nickel incorporation protein HypB